MNTIIIAATALFVPFALAACAGRDPQPIATVQAQDSSSSCAMIAAEVQANNIKVRELAGRAGPQDHPERRGGRRGYFGPGHMVRDGLQGRGRQGSRGPPSPPTIPRHARERALPEVIAALAARSDSRGVAVQMMQAVTAQSARSERPQRLALTLQ
jgi:hypothetical protein